VPTSLHWKLVKELLRYTLCRAEQSGAIPIFLNIILPFTAYDDALSGYPIIIIIATAMASPALPLPP
jgi:hypothetical protein